MQTTESVTNMETIRVIDLDGTRKLLVPSTEPKKLRGIWPVSEFERLKNEARIVTAQDRIALLEEAQRQKGEQEALSQQRKNILLKSQTTRKYDQKLLEAERDAKRRNLYLLERSYELMQEQDERVKTANRLILATKCGAIRAAQIAEKELIEKQMKDEERRMDDIMEQERQRTILSEKKKKESQKMKRKEYIGDLSNQIKYNDNQRMLEAERRNEESRLMSRLIMTLRQEERKRHQEKLAEQRRLRDVMQKASEDNEIHRQRQLEEERVADARAQAYIRKKVALEEEREKITLELKRAKEREMADMRNQLKSQGDKQAQLNEMNALRVQEEVEQRWRAQELANAYNKQLQQDKLRKERERQVNDLRKARAVRLAMDEREFHTVAHIERQKYERELALKEQRKQNAMQHCRDLLVQINEKEMEQIKQQQLKFQEGTCQVREEEIKARRVDEYIRKKIDALKEHKALANHLEEIEHKLNLKK